MYFLSLHKTLHAEKFEDFCFQNGNSFFFQIPAKKYSKMKLSLKTQKFFLFKCALSELNFYLVKLNY